MHPIIISLEDTVLWSTFCSLFLLFEGWNFINVLSLQQLENLLSVQFSYRRLIFKHTKVVLMTDLQIWYPTKKGAPCCLLGPLPSSLN